MIDKSAIGLPPKNPSMFSQQVALGKTLAEATAEYKSGKEELWCRGRWWTGSWYSDVKHKDIELVGGLEHDFYFLYFIFPYIGNVIIPTD